MMQMCIPKLRLILDKPIIKDDIHESIFRSNGILMYILEMVKRGDSKETIWDVYDFLSNDAETDNFKKVK